MYIKEELAEEKLLVQSYGDGGFRVAGERIEGAIIIAAKFANKINLKSLEELSQKNLQELLSACTVKTEKVEILLFGGGEHMSQLPIDCAKWLRQENIAFDLMNTGAAARTYNVLLSENRAVAAIMMPIN